MLRDLDLQKYTKVCLICGYTDLRLGINGLVNIIQYKLGMNPYDKQAIFLFCGRKASTIKAVIYEGDGIALVSKRLFQGRYQWPRNSEEARLLTREQFHLLMGGFTIESKIRDMDTQIPA